MNNGMKRFFAVAAVALMVPAVAAASTARMAGLNAPGDYVKGDYTGMFTYLSEVNSVGNLVYVEAGSIYYNLSDHAVGAVLPGLFDGKYGVWSFNLRQYHPALGQSWNGSGLNPYNYNMSSGDLGYDPNSQGEAFDIIWGHKMGNGNLALRVNRSFESTENGTNQTEGDGNYNRNILGFGGGYGWDMNANTQVEIGVHYQQRSFDEGTGGSTDNGGTAMLVAARAFRKAAGNLTLIPVVKYFSFENSYTTATPTDIDEKYSGWQAGLAGNWTVGSDDLLVFGAQFAQNKGDYGDETETETFMPNVFMALETHINPWLTFRAGAQSAMFYSYKAEQTNPSAEYTEKANYFNFNLGTTVKLGNLTLDAVLDPAFLQNPFAQLMGGSNAFYYNDYYGNSRGAGYNAGNTAFPMVSATYTW